jgi:sugar/nucleoside kinase (ribokinase family)
MMDKKISIVGIGNAIVDVLANVKDEFLKSCRLQKGSMKLVCEEEADLLYSRIIVEKVISGGSVANTIAGLAVLGDRVAFIGKVRDDELGNAFADELKKLGVIFNTAKSDNSRMSTARCIVLTTPDSQRTMSTCIGIAGMLFPEDIDEKIIMNSEFIFIEGYLWDQVNAKKAVIRAAELAIKSKTKIALTLSDKMCVERHRKEFNDIINMGVNCIFGNESEIIALYGSKNIKGAIKSISKLGITAAITRSEYGSIIVKGTKSWNIPADKAFVVDSTGAGDMYAAGFLHGLIRKKDLYTCGKYGSAVASEVISHFGARPEKPLLELLVEKGL